MTQAIFYPVRTQPYYVREELLEMAIADTNEALAIVDYWRNEAIQNSMKYGKAQQELIQANLELVRERIECVNAKLDAVALRRQVKKLEDEIKTMKGCPPNEWGIMK